MSNPKPLFKNKPLETQVKHSEDKLTDVEVMLKLRFSGSDWGERFAAFRDENEKRRG